MALTVDPMKSHLWPMTGAVYQLLWETKWYGPRRYLFDNEVSALSVAEAVMRRRLSQIEGRPGPRAEVQLRLSRGDVIAAMAMWHDFTGHNETLAVTKVPVFDIADGLDRLDEIVSGGGGDG